MFEKPKNIKRNDLTPKATAIWVIAIFHILAHPVSGIPIWLIIGLYIFLKNSKNMFDDVAIYEFESVEIINQENQQSILAKAGTSLAAGAVLGLAGYIAGALSAGNKSEIIAVLNFKGERKALVKGNAKIFEMLALQSFKFSDDNNSTSSLNKANPLDENIATNTVLNASKPTSKKHSKITHIGGFTKFLLFTTLGVLVLGTVIGIINSPPSNVATPEVINFKSSKSTPATIVDNNFADGREAAWVDNAKGYVKARLKDADSAKFRNVYMHKNHAVCGEVNAKNSMGGYSGFERFVSYGKLENTFLESDVTDGKFYIIYNKMCVE